MAYDAIESMTEAFKTLPQAEQEQNARMGLIGAGVVYSGGMACAFGGCEAALILGARFFPSAARLAPATREALAGGRNAGLIRQFADRTAAQLGRTIRSLEKNIAEHEQKIRNPEQNMVRDNPKDPQAVQRAVRDWQKEIRNYKEQRDIAKDVLRSKQEDCTGTRLCGLSN